MKKFIILFIILFTASLSYAQLTRISDYRWESIDGTRFPSTGWYQTNITTNFYKHVVMPPVNIITKYSPPEPPLPPPATYPLPPAVIVQTNFISVFSGTNNNFDVYIYNVGSLPNPNIQLSTPIAFISNVVVPAGINIAYSSISIPAPFQPGDSGSYSIDIGVTTNKTIIPIGTVFTFDVTNSGTGTYPYKYIVRYIATVSEVEIVFGSDGIHNIDNKANGVWDGSGTLNNSLGDLDVKIYVEIPGASINEARIYYDMNGNNSLDTGHFRTNIPDGTVNQPRYVVMERLSAHPEDPNYKNILNNSKNKNPNEIWIATIYAADPEVAPGNMVNFTIWVDGGFKDNNGVPWRYVIKKYEEQKEESETTISLNTKFDPRAAEGMGKNKLYHLIYKLNRRGHVNISVYNVRGERVRLLKNKVQEIGRHEQPWDGKNESGRFVSTGLYLVSINTAEFDDIRKVLIYYK